MPQLPPQTQNGIPEKDLPDLLRKFWLTNDPKPRKIEMVRQDDDNWTVARTYD
jgi:hypothetical protein